jgi:hypothetical protein
MRIGIIDLLGKEPPRNGYSRLMRANNASIMPQVVAVWCQEAGHQVHYAYYSGHERFAGGIPDDVDVVFIHAFSQAALVAYAMSARFRARGVRTVLGGPHARSYPEDARRFFDCVVGFCDRDTLADVLLDPGPHRPLGRYVSATRQPAELPGLRQRWPFLQPSMEAAKVVRLVPLIGSLGCPYKCSFCIDAVVPYQPLGYDGLRDDLRFFQELNLPRSCAVWHDPNFGIRFDESLDAIEEVVRPGSVTFFAEMSLALLKEENVRRLQRIGFKATAPGIESWYEAGDKSRMRSVHGMEKVRRVAEHINMVQRYIPYTQANLIFGLDTDEGPEAFELTKRFIDLAPGIYPHYALLCAFGRNAQLNLEYQREGRVVPLPFHFLDLISATNVRPKHFTWEQFYDGVIGVFDHSFRPAALARRFRANPRPLLALEQLFRGVSSDRNNKARKQRQMRRLLATDPSVRGFFDGRTRDVPEVFVSQIRADLGPLWHWLPEEALRYDPDAYLASGVAHPLPVMAAV